MQMQLAYKVARTQEGVTEVVGPQSNARINEYASTTTLKAISDETSWCSSFVNWCYIISGILLNPVMMRRLMTGVYSESEIATFFVSARRVAEILNLNFNPTMEGQSIVRLPTRSAAARSWKNFGRETKNPKEGDMVVIWRVRPTSWEAHVGFYVGKSRTSVQIFGGNQSNKVNISSYALLRVLSYRED